MQVWTLCNMAVLHSEKGLPLVAYNYIDTVSFPLSLSLSVSLSLSLSLSRSHPLSHPLARSLCVRLFAFMYTHTRHLEHTSVHAYKCMHMHACMRIPGPNRTTRTGPAHGGKGGGLARSGDCGLEYTRCPPLPFGAL